MSGTRRSWSGAARRGALAAVGGALVVDGMLWAFFPRLFAELPAACWVMAGLALAVDTRPYVLAGRRASSVILPSICFTFGIMLAWGYVPALAVQLAALAVAGVRLRHSVRRAGYLAFQQACALGAAAWVAMLAGWRGQTGPDWRDALVTVAAAGLWLAVRWLVDLLAAGVTAERRRPRRPQRWGLELFASASLLLLGPVVLAAGLAGIAVVPLVLLALHAVYRMVRSAGEFERAARTDELTGLPNRRALRMTAGDGDPRWQVALLLLDLDRFRTVNDALGHAVGDRLLVEAGRRLASCVPSHDLVVRVGGDEFAVLATRVDGPAAARRMAARLADTIGVPFALDGLPVGVSATIGIALGPQRGPGPQLGGDGLGPQRGDSGFGPRRGGGGFGWKRGGDGFGPRRGGDGETLLRQAEAAMYDAKRRGAPMAVWSHDAEQPAPDLALLADLREALLSGDADSGITLFYQPQIAVATGEVAGVEALLRWRHPERGMVGPEELLRVTEQTPVMRMLTTWVLREVVAQLATWRAAGRPLRASVNVSVRDLHAPGIAGEIHDLLQRYAVPAELLQLELTESALMADPHRVLDTITRLDRIGVAISLDDFGTGYSSLQHLRRLPLAEIKIDRSFVLGMAAERGDAAIVRSLVALAGSLGLRVVAEGVEDERTWRLLAADGCHAAQGWFHARPMPVADFDVWRARHRPLSYPQPGGAAR